uniref:Uncharacterized protein n=1 Tax=Timema genevievae TaxID=629358 RepID=A0A7R9PGI9_TIMGE|nr:unnamed protein product [Timema genevievae]
MDIVNLTCCFVAALLYYNTLDAGFVYDDSRAILTNQDVLPTTPLSNLLRNDFWGTPMNHGGSHGSYRPLCVLSFRLNYLLGGFRPWGYHLVNLLLHCLATSLVVRLASTLLPMDSAAPRLSVAATGLLFASHPIHVEAVAGVVGRADLAACVFYLSSFLCYVAHVAHRDGVAETGGVSRQLRAKGRYPREYGKYHPGGFLRSPETRSTSLVVTNETPRHVHGLRQRVVHAHEKRQRSARDNIKDYLIYFLNRFSGNNLEVKGGTSTSRFRDGDVPCAASVKQWTAMLGCVWFATCAVFSKETGVTVLGVCAAYDLLIHSRRWRGQRHGDIFNKVRERRHPPQWLIGLRRHFRNRMDNH